MKKEEGGCPKNPCRLAAKRAENREGASGLRQRKQNAKTRGIGEKIASAPSTKWLFASSKKEMRRGKK